MIAGRNAAPVTLQSVTRCLISAVAGLSALTLCAQAQPPESTERVTVHAQHVKDWNYSAAFVKALLRPSYMMQGQFPTWKIPVCPRVNGMSAPSAALIVQRIRDVAKQIGAPLDPSETCAPNIIIVVSQEPQTILDGLKTEKRLLFAASPLKDLQMHYPVQVWYYSVDRDYNGQYTPDAPPDNSSLGSSVMDVPQMQGNPTRLYTGIQPEMRVANIIADTAAIKGMPLGTFADYLALISLMQAPITGRCQPAPSIANLFMTACGNEFHATGLTNTDLALLTSLYQTPDTPERMQQVRIINNMRKNLEAAR